MLQTHLTLPGAARIDSMGPHHAVADVDNDTADGAGIEITLRTASSDMRDHGPACPTRSTIPSFTPGSRR